MVDIGVIFLGLGAGLGAGKGICVLGLGLGLDAGLGGEGVMNIFSICYLEIFLWPSTFF